MYNQPFRDAAPSNFYGMARAYATGQAFPGEPGGNSIRRILQSPAFGYSGPTQMMQYADQRCTRIRKGQPMEIGRCSGPTFNPTFDDRYKYHLASMKNKSDPAWGMAPEVREANFQKMARMRAQRDMDNADALQMGAMGLPSTVTHGYKDLKVGGGGYRAGRYPLGTTVGQAFPKT